MAENTQERKTDSFRPCGCSYLALQIRANRPSFFLEMKQEARRRSLCKLFAKQFPVGFIGVGVFLGGGLLVLDKERTII